MELHYDILEMYISQTCYFFAYLLKIMEICGRDSMKFKDGFLCVPDIENQV